MRLKIIVILMTITSLVLSEPTSPPPKPKEPPKATITRTALHVARSLDPEATQTLSVRTKSGDMATLIVKRRDSKKLVPAPVEVRSREMEISDEKQKEQRSTWKDKLEDNNQWTRLTAPLVKNTGVESRHQLEDQARWTLREDSIPNPVSVRSSREESVPNPVSVRSSDIWVKGVSSRWKAGRGLLRVGSDGIPEVTGVRVPDDESDKHQTWRNARVIDNKLFPTTSRPYTRLTRKLHYPGHVVYRASQLYSRPSQVSFEEGVRTPVLQYAHPDLGVQPARASASEVLAAAYKAQDPQPQPYGEPEPPRTFTYQHLERERPFWEKIGEVIKEHVQNGMETVSYLTRPVVEPLVEATHKISRNLGLGRPIEPQGEVDRVGLAAAPAYPVLLPALGLVAGGAALGLGAVAVGRYLDSDVVKQRNDNEEDDEDLAMEHKRAIEQATEKFQARLLYEENNDNYQENKPDNEHFKARLVYDDPSKRRKRSSSSLVDENLIDSLKSASHNPDPQIASIAKLGLLTDWSDTGCAKKAFCTALTKQGGDALMLMEKKMQTFLAIIPAGNSALHHLEEVMSAAKRIDCSSFRCHSNRRLPAILSALPR